MSTTASVPLQSKLDEILNSGINHKIEEEPMQVWDKGVFLNELLKQGIALSTDDDGIIDGGIVAKKGLEKGSYMGTRLALTEIYSILEDAAVSHFDTRGFEPIFPTQRDLDVKKAIYQWSNGKDGYPPHLQVQDNEEANLPQDERQTPDGVSTKSRANGIGVIFNKDEVTMVKGIAKAVSFLVPNEIEHEGTPYQGPTIADVERYNKANLPGADATSNGNSPKSKSQNSDIMKGRNIGEHDDWYSDARFAQQHFSGVNPCTIETAPADKVKAYIDEAKKQGLDKVQSLLEDGKDILIQDYSYFREATGVKNDQIFQNKIYELNGTTPTGKFTCRYAAASIVIFQLHEDGRLHPLAITLDYRGSLDDSITIFNNRLGPDEKGPVDEKEDWPWRYAKTVAQTADWARHEIASHLVDTHMVEEAIIVATNRTIPEDHILYQILSPHWYRTLALNAAARKLLVPGVIARVSGLGPSSPALDTKGYAYKLIDWSYKNFNFQDKYIPNDLKKRGFDIEGEKGDKYRNYPYATSINFLWGIIRDFVKSVLQTQYKCDGDVQSDEYIGRWCEEIQTQGQIESFPTITELDQLIDAVTMCIHTASPQHTAVNYLQDYYYSFVPSKPPALCTPLPQDLKALQGYTEKHLTDALPIGTEDAKWKDWLLAAQLPELLSFKVEDRYNLITYAQALWNVNKDRTVIENKKFKAVEIKNAAALLFSRLKDASLMFEYISAIQTEGTIEYPVLQPENTAISILI